MAEKYYWWGQLSEMYPTDPVTWIPKDDL